MSDSAAQPVLQTYTVQEGHIYHFNQDEEIIQFLAEHPYQMTLYLQDLLFSVKEDIVKTGFKKDDEEIKFFRTIKPQFLGKLIYYNKVYRIETTCPVSNGKMYYSYFSSQLANLKREYIEHICNSDFYRYYLFGAYRP